MKKLVKIQGEIVEVEDINHPNLRFSAVDFFDLIENLLDAKPKDRKSEEYKKWKKNINEKIKEANGALGEKMFNLVK